MIFYKTIYPEIPLLVEHTSIHRQESNFTQGATSIFPGEDENILDGTLIGDKVILTSVVPTVVPVISFY